VKKIPTLFRRDPDDRRRVLPDAVTPGCGWVLVGEGTATRKYDGTCVRLVDDRWWARREVKVGKVSPPSFEPVEHDEITGTTVGWEPAEQTGYARYLLEAIGARSVWIAGTYELCGPKVNGNPEGFERHVLVRHGADVLDLELVSGHPRCAYEAVRAYLLARPWEGIVWHHPDGRRAKLKRRDVA